jgi:hypothetical protein
VLNVPRVFHSSLPSHFVPEFDPQQQHTSSVLFAPFKTTDLIMRHNSELILILFLSAGFCCLHLALAEITGPSTVFSASDSAHLQSLILNQQEESGLFNNKLSDTYFAIDTLRELGALSNVTKREKICTTAKKGGIDKLLYK